MLLHDKRVKRIILLSDGRSAIVEVRMVHFLLLSAEVWLALLVLLLSDAIVAVRTAILLLHQHGLLLPLPTRDAPGLPCWCWCCACKSVC